ncbi:SNW domain-containing protein 1 Nuclear protein SkiP Ski-interacting protein [Larimichthys crocea]|uniref:SNW domain-containing protein 1 n=1 Tax=Larimichthys crocea TaxID=215358 RepID=A0A6G0I6B2_LARCR|nr:SNW domain-containing protein 1 Nuclear protein SkiP Ski-interacting protein [Larimichthys crocea]
MSLTSFLPAPTQLSQDQLEAEERLRAQKSYSTALVSSRREPPPYGHRKGWVPRSLEDFGDGGAFPEIHVAQFPLEMGRKKKTSNALAVQVDAEGKIKYDAIARQGQNKDKVVFSKYTDLLPKEVLNQDTPELQKPDEEAVKRADGEDPGRPGQAGVSKDRCCHACKSCRQTSSCAVHQIHPVPAGGGF